MVASNMHIFQCPSAYTTETSSICSPTILVAEECLQMSTSSLSNMMWRFWLTILIMKSIIMYGVPRTKRNLFQFSFRPSFYH
uniref:Uncharacterized protein n=1 Tax=Kuenenia stuttgartiensis TaxID=174633 RepID=Q1PVV5_KUEST|nr:unknown protein [Candidatus Kuenenia stuttgartiensis]